MKLILVVEKDLYFAFLLTQLIIRQTTYRIVRTPNAGAALNFTKHIKPNLFILDYQLPDMSGLELYEHLHVRKETRDIPVLMVGTALPQTVAVAPRSVSAKLLLDEDELLTTIETLLAPQE